MTKKKKTAKKPIAQTPRQHGKWEATLKDLRALKARVTALEREGRQRMGQAARVQHLERMERRRAGNVIAALEARVDAIEAALRTLRRDA